MSETKKVALITGANKGIGFETARQLGAEGLTVLLGARDAAKGEAAAKTLRGEGIDARFVPLDVTDESSINAAAQTVEQDIGRLDILINNAGILVPEDMNAGANTPLSVVRATYETNVFGLIAVTQAFWPLLEKSEAPRVVNLSSILGSLNLMSDFTSDYGPYKLLAYNSSKAAVNMVTVHFAHLWKDGKGKVNAAHPGYVATDINNNAGPMHVTDGAKTSVRLALLPDDGPTGGYYHQEDTLPW